MDSTDFYMFAHAIDDSGVVFYYSGEITNPIISATGEVIKRRMQAAGTDSQASRKLFSAFIELAQNMLHYACVLDGDIAGTYGRIAVGQQNGRHYVVCSNRMDASHVPSVREKLEALNVMTPEEIKAEYRRRVRENNDIPDDQDTQLGLSFLTLAKIAAEPIEFDFLLDPEAPEERAHFFLKAII